MWTFADNINYNLVRPKYQDYRCKKKSVFVPYQKCVKVDGGNIKKI